MFTTVQRLRSVYAHHQVIALENECLIGEEKYIFLSVIGFIRTKQQLKTVLVHLWRDDSAVRSHPARTRTTNIKVQSSNAHLNCTTNLKPRTTNQTQASAS